ncbi:MAG: AraC family transcriptional regulator [Lachnospiraceae bacterium]|nr:AraC family transcriptional regulator [Lachnospiraceae bacterium]
MLDKTPIQLQMKSSETSSCPREIRFLTTNTPSDSYGIHSHHFYEIYYFVSGNADYMVEGKEYHLTPHSLILLSPNSFHGVRVNTAEDYVRCSVHFPAEDVSAERRQLLLGSFPEAARGSAREIFFEHTEDFGLHPFLKNLIASQDAPALPHDRYYTIFLEALLAQISLLCQDLTPTAPKLIVPNTITELIAYLNEHLSEHITLDSLAEHFYISKYYMNRSFKKATGTTVIDYLIYKRVIFARQLILNGVSAENAAFDSGFSEYSTFYRAYKRVLGCSPTKPQPNDTL